MDDSPRQFPLIAYSYDAGPPDEAVAALRAQPPADCTFEMFGESPGLWVQRDGPVLDAAAAVCGEVRAQHGIVLSDAGVEKLWEWSADADWSQQIISQLLLMAVQRAEWTGLTVEDLVGFLRTATDSRGV
jgi:hypothetical protein